MNTKFYDSYPYFLIYGFYNQNSLLNNIIKIQLNNFAWSARKDTKGWMVVNFERFVLSSMRGQINVSITQNSLFYSNTIILHNN